MSRLQKLMSIDVVVYVLIGLVLVPGTGCRSDIKASTSNVSVEVGPTAAEVRTSLEENVLSPWYPRAVDTEYGGFLSDFSADWEPRGPQNKMVVTQARHVWTAARAAEVFPERRAEFLSMASQGATFLTEKMWDPSGGFYSLVTRSGEPLIGADAFTQGKTAYGNAFGIYGLAAYADVSGDEAALTLAQRAFGWLDKHLHDPVHGGYFQFVSATGKPLHEGWGRYPAKDQNSSIHLLEAFTELYHVWPDDTLRSRLAEMLHLVRDTLVVDPGYLQLFVHEDWMPVSYRDSSEAIRAANLELDHVSFGHDVETAYLMLEAAEALAQEPARTLRVGKRMVDHALKFGYDFSIGGLLDGAYYLESGTPPTIVLPGKVWWAQAEALNTFLLFSDLYPEDPNDYRERFQEMWSYIDGYVVDHKRGGWYWGGLDVEPERESFAKGSIWKGAYHDGRALINVYRRLEEETAAR